MALSFAISNKHCQNRLSTKIWIPSVSLAGPLSGLLELLERHTMQEVDMLCRSSFDRVGQIKGAP